MTVKELIEKLEELPNDWPVLYQNPFGDYIPIKIVETDDGIEDIDGNSHTDAVILSPRQR